TAAATAASPTPRLDPALQRRVIVEGVHPEVDGGRFPIKRTVGEEVIVGADIFADGHDALGAVLLYRKRGESEWLEVPMQPLGNDRWQARFRIDELTPYEYTIEGWVDRFGSWRHEVSKKFGAAQDLKSELLEGAALVRDALLRAPEAADDDHRVLSETAAVLGDETLGQPERVAGALAVAVQAAMARYADRSLAARYARELQVTVERERARFGAWYEMFPRSSGSDPDKGGTFADAEERLPYIASMGFDVLYLPPIHPIGRAFRKGKNNAPSASEDDVGSPWAIGGAAGGHKSVHPELGTLEDFDRFRREAERQGLELALDVALQVTPEHPYVREHPEWFKHRPDGSIQYAENPPKQYQDIYPFDFECEAWRSLWAELKSIFEFWITQGVRVFRVDNPHTKSLAFW